MAGNNSIQILRGKCWYVKSVEEQNAELLTWYQVMLDTHETDTEIEKYSWLI